MERVLKALEDIGIARSVTLVVLFFATILGLGLAVPEFTRAVFENIFLTAPFWLLPVLLLGFWYTWIWYVRAKHIAEQQTVILEVKVPRDITKSPRAMEAFFDGIAIGIGETTFIDRWIKGKVRPWFSLEIASIEGRIHFYIWTRAFLRELVEANLYAAYPNIEVYDAEDYTNRITFDPNKYDVRAADFKLGEKDPYPIKTYVDYELEKDPKEEVKIDPIAHLFETLSILGPGEQLWLQVLIRTNKDKVREVDVKTGEKKWFKKTDRWKQEARLEIEKIKKSSATEYKDAEGNTQQGFPNPTPGQIDAMKAIDRSIGKKGFDAGIRGVYIAEKERFNANRFVGMLGVYRQFSSSNLNSLSPTRWHTGFSYPWEDFKNIRHNRASRQVIDAFKRRSWFHPPYQTPHYVMTTEELATIYHFPSRTITAPGLERIPATKAEAPPNLPR